MNKSNSKPVSLALCTALVGGLALSGSAFAMQPMTQGYLVSATAAAHGDKAAEGSCGADKKAEGSCGADKKAAEGKCGMDKVDTDKDGKASRAEFDAAHPGEPAKFDTIDTNKDGFIDAAEAKAHHEGKCGADKAKGEGSCGADKKTDAKAGHAEGKCGEGKCGGAI
ncbi:MAG: HvfA family oxazolone/thioamide-modified RiPP metallophore [Pseudoxanthomonas sp.]